MRFPRRRGAWNLEPKWKASSISDVQQRHMLCSSHHKLFEVRQQSWHRPVKQSSWAVICKAALCCSSLPPPQIVYKTHTDICTPQNKLYPDSAELVSLDDENVTAFADKPSDKPGVTSPTPCPHSHLKVVNT